MRFSVPIPPLLLKKLYVLWHTLYFKTSKHKDLKSSDVSSNPRLLSSGTRHSQAVIALFGATPVELNAAYHPGKTEACK